MALQILTGVLLAQGAAAEPMRVPICTASGIQWVALDTAPQPDSPEPADPAPFCPLCLSAQSPLVLPPPAAPAIVVWTPMVRVAAMAAPAPRLAAPRGPNPARAPPAGA